MQKKGRKGDRHFDDLPGFRKLIEEIKKWSEGHKYSTDSGPVFRRAPVAGGDARRSADGRIKDWRGVWDRAMEKCEEERSDFGQDEDRFKSGLHFHGFRATAITELLEAGVQTKEVMLLSNHKTPQMVQRYNNPDISGSLGQAQCVIKIDPIGR